MNGYLIPANSKRGTLIFNVFRPIDVFILAGGVGLTLIILTWVPSTDLVATILSIMPALICGLLVMPVPNYHNVLCAIESIYKFYTKRRKFIWKGWNIYEQIKTQETKPTK